MPSKTHGHILYKRYSSFSTHIYTQLNELKHITGVHVVTFRCKDIMTSCSACFITRKVMAKLFLTPTPHPHTHTHTCTRSHYTTLFVVQEYNFNLTGTTRARVGNGDACRNHGIVSNTCIRPLTGHVFKNIILM